jgi:hypothetical protein
MRKASEYHLRAAECRGLASRAGDPEHKSMLATMAETLAFTSELAAGIIRLRQTLPGITSSVGARR